jgi:hypothetical protein
MVFNTPYLHLHPRWCPFRLPSPPSSIACEKHIVLCAVSTAVAAFKHSALRGTRLSCAYAHTPLAGVATSSTGVPSARRVCRHHSLPCDANTAVIVMLLL